MIFNELYKFAQNNKLGEDFYFEKKKIDFYIVLDINGNFKSFDSVDKEDMVFCFPRRGAKIVSGFVTDNSQYEFGGENASKKSDRTGLMFDCFKDLINKASNSIDDIYYKSLVNFVNSDCQIKLARDEFKTKGYDQLKISPIGLFVVQDGSDFVIIKDRPDVISAWKQICSDKNSGLERCICSVSGKEDLLPQLYDDVIKKSVVPGVVSTGAVLVSFDKDSFCSYNMKNSKNASIGQDSHKKITSALRFLFGEREARTTTKGKQYRARKYSTSFGKSAICFWSDENLNPLIKLFNLDVVGLGGYVDEIAIKAFTAPMTLKIPEITDQEFHMLCVTGCDGRIAFKGYLKDKLSLIVKNVSDYFEQTDIGKDKKYPVKAFFDLVEEEEAQRKLVEAVFFNRQIPVKFYHKAISGFCAHDKNQYHYDKCVALIKMALIRNGEGKVLNENNKDSAYLLGRLFAVYEKGQKDAKVGNDNQGLRGNFFKVAMSNPASIFPNLQAGFTHHSSKVKMANLDRALSDIYNCFSDDYVFPADLNVTEQGKFILGYYHQNKKLYTKVEAQVENVEPEIEVEDEEEND